MPMVCSKDELLAEVKQIEIVMNFVSDDRLTALAGSGVISITLYRRLTKLMKAAKELVSLARTEVEEDS